MSKLPRNPTTLVMAYYRNPGMLRKYYDYIDAMPARVKEGLQVIVVDDGSPPEQAAFLPEKPIGVPVQVYKMLVDIRWNQDACRNVGVKHATTPWVLITDMDHLVTPEAFEQCIHGDLSPQNAYCFERLTVISFDPYTNIPYKPHPNTWFITKAVFDASGGYDERFAGWYGTDADFRDRLRLNTKKICRLDGYILRVPREVIPDASTTTYARKTVQDSENIRRIKGERNELPTKARAPLRNRFPYERVS